MDAKTKIARARTQLVIFQPFFASLVLRLDCEPKPDEWFASKGLDPNIATDGKGIYYSEAFIDQQTLRQVEGLLAHEVGHCFLHHSTRRDWRDKDIWNQAADAVLNPILKEAQFELPEGAIGIPDADTKSTEQLYAILEKQAQKQPKGGGGQGKGGGKGKQPPGQQPGSVFDSNDSAAERSHQEQEWNVAVQQAAQAAKQAGNLPASLERFIEEMKKPTINWIEVLRRFFEETNPADYQWFPCAKRYIAQGDFMPSIKKEGYGTLTVAVDVSGSIDLELLRQFVSELNSIISDLKPQTVDVLYFDTRITKHDTFHDGEQLVVEATGGGGTAFEPVFEYIEKKDLNPRCILVLTDMQANLHFKGPDTPTLWVTQDSSLKGEFGETLVMPPN